MPVISGPVFDTEDAKHRARLCTLFSDLRHHSCAGMKYFEHSDGPTNRSFYSSYQQLLGHLVGGIESGVDTLLGIAARFDFDPIVRGNGYRSIIAAIERCCEKILTLCKEIRVNRESYLFSASHYSKELEAYVTTLGQLRACVYYLRRLVSYCRDGQLHADESTLSSEQYSVAEKLMAEVEALCQESFYGRCLAFQFCSSMRRPLEVINMVMASYGEAYGSSTSPLIRLTTSLLSSLKYIWSPDLRAKQVVNLTRNNDVQFCKAFWALGENVFLHKAPLLVCPSTAVDRLILLPPHADQPLLLPLVKNKSETTVISPPCLCDISHDNNDSRSCQAVHTRLISTVVREGQMEAKRCASNKVHPPSRALVVHFHGGGFVAQSSASHEVYLRHWAADLNVPVFSVDYSLAPEKQFPYQLDEAFYAYCWAIKHAALLGSTAERVCVAGDSAGGNLAVAVAMRAANCGVRSPDGVVSVYGCLLVKYTPSPSRILALMDPLVPLGALSMCLGAYAGLNPADEAVTPRTDAADGEHATSDGGPPVLSSSTVEDPSPFGPYVHNLVPLSPTLASFPDRRHHNSGDSGISEASPIGSRVCESHSGDAVDGADSQRVAAVDKAEHEQGEADNESERTGDKSRSLLGVPLWKKRLTGESLPKCASLPSCCEAAKTAAFSKPPSGHEHDPPVWKLGGDDEEDLPRADRCFHDVARFANLRHFAQSPIEQSKRVRVAENPYLSPLMATDDLLAGLRHVHLISCNLDPMLDDSIMFAKRLRSLQSTSRVSSPSVSLELLPDLPHGFLNFVLVSAEAMKGSERCVLAIRNILHLQSACDTPSGAATIESKISAVLRTVTPVASGTL